MIMTRVDRLVKKHGSLSEFKKAVWYAYDTLMITEAEALDGIRKYEEELRIARLLDESNIIEFKELKKIKKRREKDKIVKDLLEFTDRFKK